MAYYFNPNTDAKELDAFVLEHPLGNILQQSKWADIKNNWGHRFVSVMKNGKIVLTAMILVKDLPAGFKLYYIPRGPICDYSDKELLEYFFANLKKMGKKEHAICAKFDPLVIHDAFFLKDHTEFKTELDDTTKLLISLGCKHYGYNLNMYEVTQPRTQAVFYFHENWKNEPSSNLKKYLQRAKNKGVQMMRADKSKLDIFADLLEKTGERKGVSLRNKEYFERMMDVYGDDCAVYLTYLDQKAQLEKNEAELKRINDDLALNPRSEKKMVPIRQTILGLEKEIERLKENIAIDGDVAWISGSMCVKNEKHSELFYAGMDGKYSKYYGSYMSYLAAIEWSGDAGCVKNNFGGVQGSLDDGLTPFKDVFQPTFEEYVGEFDYPILSVVYPMFTKALPVAKKAIKAMARRK